MDLFFPDFFLIFPLFSRFLANISLSGVALCPPCIPSGEMGLLDDEMIDGTPLITWWEIRGHNAGPLWWLNWDPLITWWEIKGHHFNGMMRKLGALDGAMENVEPFVLWSQWGNWKPLIKQWENCKELNDLMRKTRKIGPLINLRAPLMTQWAN